MSFRGTLKSYKESCYLKQNRSQSQFLTCFGGVRRKIKKKLQRRPHRKNPPFLLPLLQSRNQVRNVLNFFVKLQEHLTRVWATDHLSSALIKHQQSPVYKPAISQSGVLKKNAGFNIIHNAFCLLVVHRTFCFLKHRRKPRSFHLVCSWLYA